MKILILGGTGMLGSMLVEHLSKIGFEVISTYHRTSLKKLAEYKGNEEFFNANSDIRKLKYILKFYKPDFVINSIGIIKPFCQDNNSDGVLKAIQINSKFPHILSKSLQDIVPESKIIQIATDCVYDGVKGNYSNDDAHNPLDVYGKTKSLGEVYKENFLNIRCSIIGPELKSKISLMEWFLNNQNAEIEGYQNHYWNGVTTLQFAQLCSDIISNNLFNNFKLPKTFHYVKNTTLSKFELLKIFNDVFDRKKVIIPPKRNIEGIDRTIKSSDDVILMPMRTAVEDLKIYMESSDFFRRSL